MTFEWKTHGELDIEIPDNWNGGNVYHTGGGIYVREWEREMGEKTIQVGYNNNNEFVGVNVYESDDKSYGPIDTFSIHDTGSTDISHAIMAKALMERINKEGLDTFE